MYDVESPLSMSEGLRLEDLRVLRELLDREIFRTQSRLNSARGLGRQEQAAGIAALDGLRSRVNREIRWAQQAGIPGDRLRQLYPELVKAARLALREEHGYVDQSPLQAVVMQIDAALLPAPPLTPPTA